MVVSDDGLMIDCGGNAVYMPVFWKEWEWEVVDWAVAVVPLTTVTTTTMTTTKVASRTLRLWLGPEERRPSTMTMTVPKRRWPGNGVKSMPRTPDGNVPAKRLKSKS